MNHFTTIRHAANMLAVVITCLFLISCKNTADNSNRLGIAEIKVSGDPEAIPFFNEGLLLLHSFEYEDARDAFLKAQEIDPLMAMSYWGEAMTHNHPLWREQNYERGRSTIERWKIAASNVDISEVEEDFINSVEILYSDDPSKVIRDQAYANFLEKMHGKYPGNHEVAAFYSLSLLGSVPIGRDERIYEKAAVIARKILDDNSQHPGALHYLIHSYDDPDHAYLAETAADSYSVVAPDASHALHMPSHIYVALGNWDKVVASNEHSYQASLNRMERKQLGHDARGYHAYHWLEYGYLQQKRAQDAEKLVRDMQRYAAEEPSVRGRTHMVYLKGTYLVETENWDSQIADIKIEIKDLNIADRSRYNFLEGVKAFAKRDGKELDRIIQLMKDDYELEALSIVDTNITVCTSQTGQEAIQSDIDESEIMVMQLQALSFWLEGDTENTEKWLQLSVKGEGKLSYSYGPPVIQKPTNELYADWLMENERSAEALKYYKLTLDRAPNRVKALEGIKKASSQIDQKLAVNVGDLQDGGI